MDLENQRDDDETFNFDSSRSLTKCSTTMPTLEFKHHWDIAQFSVHQEISQPGDCITGARFGDDDHEFLLKLFPTGKDEECSGYLSLFLQISKCPMPKLQFRVNFIIDTMDGPRGCALNKAVVTINRGGIVTASKFFSIEQLKARSQRYLPNDVLRIVTDMTVYGEPNSYSVDPLDDTFPELASSSSLTHSRLSLAPTNVDLFKESSLEKLLHDSTLADFKVHIEEQSGERKTFRLHKAILAARSAYFEGLLKHGNKEFDEGQVVIKDVSIAVMTKVIHFMYTMKVPELDELTPDVIYAADRFLVQPLKNCLMACLGRNITVDNVFARLEMSYRLSDDRVFKKAAVLFARNRSTLTATEDWMRLKKQCPMLATEILEAAYDDGDTNKLNNSTNKRRRTSS